MKKICFLIILSLILSFVSCSQTPVETSSVEMPYPVTVREIELLEKPDRVVSLSPWISKTMDELGLSGALVGVSDYCEVKYVDKMGIPENPDIEAIIKAEPDFVLISQEITDEAREFFSKNNIPVYTIKAPSTLNELIGIFSDLVTIFEGKTDGLLRGQAIAEEIIYKANKLNEILAPQEKSVLFCVDEEFYITGDTLLGDVIRTIGLINAAEDFTNYVIPKDELKKLSYDLLILDEKSATTDDDATEIRVDTQKITSLTPSFLDEFAVLVGGIDLITPPVSSEETSSEVSSQ